MHFDERFILSSVPGSQLLQGTLSHQPTVSIDSRTISPGDMFVALPGSAQDGHDFLEQVIDRKASCLIIRDDKKECLKAIDKKKLASVCIITVPDTFSALIEMARAWRNLFTIPVVGITGSIGKTTTKNILASIVKEAGCNYLVSQGNQNTLIGVSLNILRLNAQHQGAIFEIGINQRGEMDRIVALVRPTTALITGIGHSHMQGLGSLADIAAEKRDIFKYLQENNVGFVNGDQAILSQVSYNHPVIKFGLKTTNQVQARKITIEGNSTHFSLKIYKDKYAVTLPVNHSGRVINTLAAVAIAQYLNIPHAAIIAGIQKPIEVAGRFEQRSLASTRGIVINDCYNASPESMKAALLAFQKYETQARKVAVLGDMLELGSDSAFWHRQLGRFLRKVPSLQHVILVGSLVEWTKKTIPVGLSVDVVPTWQDALLKVKEHILQQELAILVKGSLGVGLTHIVEDLTARPSYEK